MKQKWIEEIRIAHKATTPGEWFVDAVGHVDVRDPILYIDRIATVNGGTNALFIVLAHERVSDLLDALEKAQRIADERLLTIGEYAELNVVKNAEIARLQESQAAAHCDLAAYNVELEKAQSENERLHEAFLNAGWSEIFDVAGDPFIGCRWCYGVKPDHYKGCPFKLLEDGDNVMVCGETSNG